MLIKTNTVSANQTLTMASDKNYFLAGTITIANNVTYTVTEVQAIVQYKEKQYG